ncbi:hypothetical protein PAXINDRAFT_104064 [Paxillus involutus ATCC 200175]|uniref:Uncharacterized protein n=1 Tax=Paxillus involutus ATCC 200175 TaxID=664439 RepID=A0A0C9T8Z4_PAXIN|nr:hypothetical protein PAXINDRAFT_104064 [Paxillus involutus ATCC 200175]
MARIIAPLATSRGQQVRCRPITSHTRTASVTLPASFHTTPPASSSLAKLYEVANVVLPNAIAESTRFTSSPRACDTTTPALVMIPTGIGSSIASPSAQSDNDPSSSGPLPAMVVGTGSVLGAVAFVSLLALALIFYHRERSVRSHCHVNPNLKKHHLSISPVPPPGSGEQGEMIITPFPPRDLGFIIEPGGPVDGRAGEISELEWRVSRESVSESYNHQVGLHTRPTPPMTPTPPVLHWDV